MRVWGERNEKELCGQVSLTTLELKRLKVSLLQTSSDPLQCKSALCFSKKRNVVYINMGFPGGASGKEPTCQCRRQERPRFDPWVRKIPWSRKWQPIPIFLPGESQGQNSLAGYSLCVRDMSSIPWSGGLRHGGGHHYPLLCSCLENPMDQGACQAMVHSVTESDTTEGT